MGIPLPPGIKKPETDPAPSTVTGDEISFILQSELLAEHREDPNVIRWISNYLVCRDAKQAAIDAGLPAKAGPNLKNRPDIYRAILAITAKANIKYGYDAAEIVERTKEIAFLDPIEFENEDGTFKEHLKDIAPEARRAIKKFKAKNIYEKDPNGMDVVIGKLIEVEFYDKQSATKTLGQEKDIFKEKKVVEHDVSSSMKNILLASTRRAEEHAQKMLHGAIPAERDVTSEPDSE